MQDNCAPSAADGRNFSRFFTGVSSKKCDMAGDWVRLKKGPYGGDLAQAFSNFFVRRISGDLKSRSMSHVAAMAPLRRNLFEKKVPCYHAYDSRNFGYRP